jgi:dTDP-glucose pyrophosphorylase
MTTVLILAADGRHDQRDDGYPLCLTEIGGKPLIQLLIEKCGTIADARLIVAVEDADCRRWHLDNVVHQLDATASMLRVYRPTAGAACTALLAVSQIVAAEPLLIINGNELVDVDFRLPIAEFNEGGYDGGAVTFPSIHPRYSYVRLNSERSIIETSEKNPISQHATAGFYWFRAGEMFVKAAERMILKNGHVNGRYYICPTFNELILDNARLGVYPIETAQYHPIKSERQIERLDTPIETGGRVP